MTNQKENWDEDCRQVLEGLKKDGKRPTLFLHACCGPCLTYPLTWLNDYFDITIGYFNPNIYPEAEYEKRLGEIKRFLASFNQGKKEEVKVVALPFNYDLFIEKTKGHEEDKEGGQRCTICHTLRLDLAYSYAFKNHFQYFATVMTVSSKKPSDLLNRICLELSLKYPGTVYLPSDFRKRDGQLKGIMLAKECGLYRQDYCGCSFSLNQREAQKAEKKRNGYLEG
ncbi:MAG: epoxyqueuosine reductase QueH [Bacilli bacterium]|jgi:predicted adenine nucleotide alpha hydrolase (AANH) superfamily ATPase|nr:epoxyqueuosine reductase QueH [Bacilli bacterium]